MDIEVLKKHVTKARKVLELHHKKLSESFLGRFPFGSCGTTSDLLSEWLQAEGFKNIKCVSGKRGDASHGWLEWNGYIIDITSDQFNDGLGEVYIGTDRTFHDTFLYQECSEPGMATAVGWIYSDFCELMESEKNNRTE